MHAMLNLLFLAGLSVAYNHASRRLERLRRAVTANRVPNMLAVWTLAAVALLPVQLIALAVCSFYAADWRSRSAAKKAHPCRFAYSCGASCIAAVTAGVVLLEAGTVAGVVLAVATFTTVNIGLISIGMIVRHQKAIAIAMFSKPRAHLVEFAGQGMGIALGEAALGRQPLGLLLLPALYVLHRYAAQDAIESSGAYDPVMRLWNEAGWSFQASELIAQCRFVTVFVIDAGLGQSAVVADMIRPCLTRSAVLGAYSDTQVVAICDTSCPVAAEVIVRRVVAALERGGAGLVAGSRSARFEDVSEMLTHALTDLMAARDHAGTATHW